MAGRVGLTLAVGALVVGVVACAAGTEDVDDAQAELLGFADIGDAEAVFESFHRENLRIQELIVACMAEQGFEYLPVEPAVDPRAGGTLSAEEYRERYGWGMMLSLEETLTGVPADLDPNIALRAEMDAATLLAWEEALYGPEESRLDAQSREGCEPEAEYQVYAYQDTQAWAEIEPLLWEIPERILADPRTIAADRDWASCMAEAGYDVSDVDEPYQLVDAQVIERFGAATPPPGEPEVTNPRDIQPWFVETDGWQDLVEFELELAEADRACDQDLDLLAEYQQQFLDDHADLLEQLQTELAEQP